MDNCEGNMK